MERLISKSIIQDNMRDVGRPTDLTDELFRKIKKSILEGNDLKTTASVCEINEQTLYDWKSRNYLSLGDKIEGWKRDRKLMLAEQNIESIMCLGISDKDSLKVVADVSKFVAETLGKESYSKRSELTGKNGDKLIPKPILDVQEDNSNKQDIESKQED